MTRHRRNFGTRFTMSNDVAISTVSLAILSDMIPESDGRPDRQTRDNLFIYDSFNFGSVLIHLNKPMPMALKIVYILTLCKVCLNRDFFIIAATNVSHVTETADLVR